MSDARKNAKHKAAMEKQKASIDASIDAADTERGVAVLLTGDGKGKSSSAFGMVMRALVMATPWALCSSSRACNCQARKST